jgi:Tfp pilus assembly protein PilF
MVFRHLRRYPEAIIDLDKALQLDPNVLLNRNNRAVVYLATGDCHRAIEDFRSILQKGEY